MRISGQLLSDAGDTMDRIQNATSWEQQIRAIKSTSDEDAVSQIITANIIKTIQTGGISMIGELNRNIEAFAHDAAQNIGVDESKVISEVWRHL